MESSLSNEKKHGHFFLSFFLICLLPFQSLHSRVVSKSPLSLFEKVRAGYAPGQRRKQCLSEGTVIVFSPSTGSK